MNSTQYLYKLIYDNYLFEPRDDFIIKLIESDLKKIYPGEYKLKWVDPDNSQTIEFIWLDSNDELAWKLKYD